MVREADFAERGAGPSRSRDRYVVRHDASPQAPRRESESCDCHFLGHETSITLRRVGQMQHAVGIFVAVVTVAVTIAACAARPETSPIAEVPPQLRLAAAPSPPEPDSPTPEASPPHLAGAFAGTEMASPPNDACPAGMLLVDGDYCKEVRETCLDWEDPPANKLARCAKFGPTECVGERVHKRFCIDRDEYVAPGDELPTSDVSWTQAKEICEGESKRLCMETEWEFACEGEQMLPYPTGYDRDPKLCNFDKDPLLDRKGKLLDLREREDERASCVSPFGVRNMSGNVDEWVFRDRTNGEWRSALKGGWWMPARDRCRPATTAHDERFHQLQTGVRCCAAPQ
jgi:sulfatase modifying factor 1